MVAAALKQRVAGSSTSSGSSPGKPPQQALQLQTQLRDAAPVVAALLQLMAVLVSDNSANKLSLRESGALASLAVLLDIVITRGAAGQQATSGGGVAPAS